MKRFWPEYDLPDFSAVDRDFIRREGIRGVILDIDNTLEPYENPEPGEAVRAWFSMLAEEGVHAAFVSNNEPERVARFNRDLGLPAYAKAGKPLAKNVRRAISDIGTTPEETLLMGDQIFTDVLAAHNAGIRAALVPPIRDKRNFITRFKRMLERPILRRMRRKMRKNEEKS